MFWPYDPYTRSLRRVRGTIPVCDLRKVGRVVPVCRICRTGLNGCVRLPYSNCDIRGAACVQVVPARSPEPPTFHVKHWVRRILPLPINSPSRPQEPSADCFDWPEWTNRMFMCCAHPRPREKVGRLGACEEDGPRACFVAELYFLLQGPSEVSCGMSACFSDLVELSSLMPMRKHRGEGDISSRTCVGITSRSTQPRQQCGLPCRAGQDGRAPFASSPTSCTVCPKCGATYQGVEGGIAGLPVRAQGSIPSTHGVWRTRK